MGRTDNLLGSATDRKTPSRPETDRKTPSRPAIDRKTPSRPDAELRVIGA